LYVLLPLLPPLVLLAVMGMAWVEEHLLPPAGPPPPAQTPPVAARDTLTAEPAERPQRPHPVPGRARDPARGHRNAPALATDLLIAPDPLASRPPGQLAVWSAVTSQPSLPDMVRAQATMACTWPESSAARHRTDHG
jgi:hypothetical protein